MIQLRPVELRDAEIIYHWRNDEEIMYWGAGNYGDASLTFYQIEEIIRNQRSTDHSRWFMVEIHQSQEVKTIGMVTFRDFDRIVRSVTIGILIGDKEYWGKGYGTETIQKFTEFLFTRYNLHRIHLDTFLENARAIRAYEKCGFIKEGLLRKAFWTSKGYQDRIIMGLLFEDWKRLREG